MHPESSQPVSRGPLRASGFWILLPFVVGVVAGLWVRPLFERSSAFSIIYFFWESFRQSMMRPSIRRRARGDRG